MKNKDDNKLVIPEKTYKFTSSSPKIKLESVELIALWEHTQLLSSKNSSIFRVDPAGALIKLSEYEKKTQFGWVIQPVDIEKVPYDIDINSLVAIHWMNAESRLKTSKKDSTSFIATVTRVDNPLLDENIKKDKIIQNKSLFKNNFSTIWSKKERKSMKQISKNPKK